MRSIGQAVCSAIVATILANLTMAIPGGAAPTLHAYQTVFAVAGAVAILALGIATFIPRRSAARATQAVDTNVEPAPAGAR